MSLKTLVFVGLGLLVLAAPVLAQAGPDSWGNLDPVSSPSISEGSALVAIDAETLVLAVSNQQYLFKYHRSNGIWDTEAALLPAKINTVSAMTHRPGSSLVYLTVYSGGQKLVEYDTNTGAIQTFDMPKPSGAQYPAMLAATTTSVYAVIYEYAGNFLWQFDAGGWTRKAAAPGSSAYALANGATLAYPGTGNFLYDTVADYQHSFYRYAIADATLDPVQSQAADTWVTLAPVPSNLGNSDAVGWDTAMVPGPAGTLLLFPGAGDWNTPRRVFLQYVVSTNSWTRLADTPESNCTNDMDMAIGGSGLAWVPGTRYVYAVRGQNTQTFWRYEMAAQPPNAPVPMDPFMADGITPVPADGTPEDGFIIPATVSHPQGDLCSLEAEVKPTGAAFDGTGTVTGASASFDVAAVAVSGLAPGAWQWRVRSVDSKTLTSAWVNSGVDVVVLAKTVIEVGSTTEHKGVCGSVGFDVMLPAGLLLLWRRFRRSRA